MVFSSGDINKTIIIIIIAHQLSAEAPRGHCAVQL